jgi:hypothetical protein
MEVEGLTLSSDKWQLKASTVRDRNELMFKNELLSDVHFLVGHGQERIPGHKYVLAISSPVFLAMFYGKLAEKGEEIPVVDSDVDAFVELLRFLYTDKVLLTLDNALGVLYLAKKYILPVLADKCITFVKNNINSDNVLTVLSHSLFLNEKFLEEECWNVVDLYTSKVLESEHFTELDIETLVLLVKRNSLSIREVSLFHAVKRWAITECSRKNLDQTSVKLRTVASKALKFIRYPVMSPVEFADEVARTGLLSYEEVTSIFLFFLSSLETKISFEINPRVPKPLQVKVPYRCSRFKSCCGSDWFCDTRKNDGIKFMTDQSISLRGIGVYGPSKTEGDYKVYVEVIVHDKLLAHNKISYSAKTCDIVQDILFEESIAVVKNVIYTINVLMKGPCSLSGTHGQRNVIVEGTKFTFLEYTSPNGTSLSAGQIPEIIFDN